jgi:hypothetical protein
MAPWSRLPLASSEVTADRLDVLRLADLIILEEIQSKLLAVCRR